MSPGVWVVLAVLLAASAFGVWRARTDGRFRGGPVREPEADAWSGESTPLAEDGPAEVQTPGVSVRAMVGGAVREDAFGERRRRALERSGDVGGLHRNDHHVGVRHRPRRARHHVDAVEGRLERTPAIGVDLGDGEAVGFPPGIEQPGEERLSHAPTAQERQPFHGRRVPSR